jgi:hypothetical protein
VKRRHSEHLFERRPLYYQSVWLDRRHWLDEPWVHVGLIAVLLLAIWLGWLLASLVIGPTP